MKHSLFLFIVIILSPLLGIRGVFAGDITCPAPTPKTEKELTPEYIGSKIQACSDARKANKEGAISSEGDFYCPSGNFTVPDGKAITDETVAYHVSVSIFFAEIDKEVMQYICKLREARETNIIIASNDIRTKLEGVGKKGGLLEKYDTVCNFSYIQGHINTEKKVWIESTDTYPQTVCTNIAANKKTAWKSLAYMLMSDGAAKGYQNDKDTFIDKVKTKYDTVREKFHSLLELLDKATTNLDALIKKSN